LIGRERLAAEVAHLLQQPGIRLLTLTGPGGIGKTRLALHVAAEVTAAFPNGVRLVSLAAVTDPRRVIPEVAWSLGVPDIGDDGVFDRLAALLQAKSVLLVLDNVEQVVDAAPQLVDLLAACPRLVILVTSRVRLRVSGERDVVVPPLTVPGAGGRPSPTDVLATEAVRCFAERAQAVKRDFMVTDENAAVVAEICRRLDGLPLAIELAAAWIKLLSPPALLARLERRLPLLTGGGRDLPARQQTMRDTIAWSHDLLPADEQTLFRRLAAFTGGFSLDAADAIAADLGPEVLEYVASLVDKSLLSPAAGVDDEPRFAMLETIREFGLERLAASGEEDAVRRWHTEYFVSLGERAEPALPGAPVAWLKRFDADHDNLRAALAWMETTNHGTELLQLTGVLAFFWYYRGHLSEGARWLERALELAPDSAPPAIRARALTGAGLLAHVRGDADRAIARLTDGVACWQEAGDAMGETTAHGLLGGVLVSQGEYERAATLFEAGLNRFRERGWYAFALFHLGAIAFAHREDDRAEALCHEAVALYDEHGWRLDAIDPLRYLGLLACRRGDYEQAAAFFAENFRRLQERASPAAIATELADVATLATARGRWNEAARLFGAADALQRAERATFSLPARDTYAAAVASARAALGEQAYGVTHAAGQVLTLAQAVAVATEVLATAPEDGNEPVTGSARAAVPDAGLTERELDVLRLLVTGKTNPKIAAALSIGAGTVRNHVSHILAKLGAKARTEAAGLAHQQGLV
jgi:predicted ATPase/DNA-binding CsgD family transcriptional regulator